MNKAYWIDCMDFLSDRYDRFYDLAVCDPQYGIKANHTRTGFMNHTMSQNADNKDWDNERMPAEYIRELFRVSKRVILFGYQYYSDLLPPTKGMIIWDKKNGKSVFSDCECAFDSQSTAVRMFSYKWVGLFQEDMKNPEKRIHPTQKPVALYKWIYQDYLKIKDFSGIRVLDTHLGSGSNRIAAYDLGIGWFEGCEKEKDYWERQEVRFNCHIDPVYCYNRSIKEDLENGQLNLFRKIETQRELTGSRV